MLEEMRNNRLCMDVFCPYIDVLVFSYLFTFVVQFFFCKYEELWCTLFAFEGIIFSCICRN